MNNSKQLNLALRLYTDDNNDCLPSALEDEHPQPRPVVIWGTMDWNGGNRSNWDVEEDIKKSCIWEYAKNASVFRCPADRSKVTIGSATRPRVRSYGFSQVFTLKGPNTARRSRTKGKDNHRGIRGIRGKGDFLTARERVGI